MIIGALGVLVAAGVVEGMRSNRWGVSGEAKAAVARLARVPAAFGAWTSTEAPLDRKILDRAEATGSVSRVYKNTATKAQVSVLLLCGPAGPIASHTPDVCYAGLGYQMAGGELRKTITLPDGSASTYWTARFDKAPGEPGLSVSWAWGVDGTWTAAERPRAEFIRHDTLYKLYVTRGLPPAGPGAETEPPPDPTAAFLTEFLPEVKTALAPATE